MDFILNLLVTTGAILVMAQLLAGIQVKNFLTALWVACLTGLFTGLCTAALAWLLLASGLLDMLTILLFYYLNPVATLLVTAVVLKVVARLVPGFKVDGMKPALIIALVVTVALSLVGLVREESEAEYASLQGMPELEQVKKINQAYTVALYSE